MLKIFVLSVVAVFSFSCNMTVLGVFDEGNFSLSLDGRNSCIKQSEDIFVQVMLPERFNNSLLKPEELCLKEVFNREDDLCVPGIDGAVALTENNGLYAATLPYISEEEGAKDFLLTYKLRGELKHKRFAFYLNRTPPIFNEFKLKHLLPALFGASVNPKSQINLIASFSSVAPILYSYICSSTKI